MTDTRTLTQQVAYDNKMISDWDAADVLIAEAERFQRTVRRKRAAGPLRTKQIDVELERLRPARETVRVLRGRAIFGAVPADITDEVEEGSRRIRRVVLALERMRRE